MYTALCQLNPQTTDCVEALLCKDHHYYTIIIIEENTGKESAVSGGEDEERTCGEDEEEQWRNNEHKLRFLLMKIFTIRLRVKEVSYCCCYIS